MQTSLKMAMGTRLRGKGYDTKTGHVDAIAVHAARAARVEYMAKQREEGHDDFYPPQGWEPDPVRVEQIRQEMMARKNGWR
jgi:hypothetical protein